MQKKLSSPKETTAPFSPFLFILFSFLILSSCNNNGGKKDTAADSATKLIDTAQKGPTGPLTNIYLNSFIVDAKTLQKIFKNQDINVAEIYFTSVYDANEGFLLSASGKGKKGNSITGEFPLNPTGTKITLPPNAKVNSQVFTRGGMKSLLGLTTGYNDIIKNKDFRDILITPCPSLGTDNLVFYIVSFASDSAPISCDTKGVGQEFLKPSPPAGPCDTGCDDPMK